MSRALGTVAVVFLALSVLWFAGEQHRENCIRADRIHCSVLPWNAGHARPLPTPSAAAQHEIDVLRALGKP